MKNTHKGNHLLVICKPPLHIYSDCIFLLALVSPYICYVGLNMTGMNNMQYAALLKYSKWGCSLRYKKEGVANSN